MIKVDLSSKMIITSRIQREQEIFKHIKAFMGSPSDKGNGYAKKNSEFYIGDEAKEVITASLVKGLSGEQFYNEFDFVENKMAMSVGVTLVAHGIQSSQTGVLANVENAEQLINDYIDFVEDYRGYK